MSALTSALSDGKLAGRVFDERQLGEAIDGGAARRYALVNRALKDGSLVRSVNKPLIVPGSAVPGAAGSGKP